MIKIEKIIKYLDYLFPNKKSEKWDKTGLQIENSKNKISNILISLDLTSKVLNKAINNKVKLIIVHHPFLWEKTKKEEYNKAPYKKEIIKIMKKNKISLYVMHTNYDSNKKGTGHQIFSELGFTLIDSIKKIKYAKIINEPLKIEELKKLFYKHFSFKHFIENENIKNKTYKKISILPGSGSIEDIIICKKKGIELIITSDIKWSDWITIKELKINVLEVSHEVEKVFSKHIFSILQKKFKEINVLYI